MSSSELSELESPNLSDDDGISNPVNKGKLEAYFKKDSTALPPKLKRKRAPSPPHEYVLADKPEIAQLAMFVCRFKDAFQKTSPGFPDYGPQDIEEGLNGPVPGELVERLLCGLLTLVLNRKKIPVEKGRYSRALEEAVLSHKTSWEGRSNGPWKGRNPLHGGGKFETMTALQRLTMLQTLAMWCLDSSDEIRDMIKECYKGSRQPEDRNVTLAVQQWGQDGDRRRYWLIRGVDGTHFRVYRENDPVALEHKHYSEALRDQKANGNVKSNGKTFASDASVVDGNELNLLADTPAMEMSSNAWRSVAGNTAEVERVAARLNEDESRPAGVLSHKMLAAITILDRSEELRVAVERERLAKAEARDRRQARKAHFARPEPGYSLYAGRTRNKTVKYTYSDDEDDESTTRRSTRNSGTATPAEPAGPTFTASGRQVRSRHHGAYGESMLSNELGEAAGTEHEGYEQAASNAQDDFESLNDENDDDEAELSSGLESGVGDTDEEDDDDLDEDAMDLDRDSIMTKQDDDSVNDDTSDLQETERTSHSLVVTLRYAKLQAGTPALNGSFTDTANDTVPFKQAIHSIGPDISQPSAVDDRTPGEYPVLSENLQPQETVDISANHEKQHPFASPNH